MPKTNPQQKPTFQTLEQTVARIKREVIDDVKNGLVPINAESFGEIHDFRDANTYGGLCDDKVTDPIIEHLGGRPSDGSLPDKFMDYLNDAQSTIDTWIRDGMLVVACEAQFGNEWVHSYADLLRHSKSMERLTDSLLSNLRLYPDPGGVISAARTKFTELRNA